MNSWPTQNQNILKLSNFNSDFVRIKEARMKLDKKFTKNVKKYEIHVYFVLVVIRVLFVFIPQYGYIHPDEFFQTTEVVSGKIEW